jgi:GAF domain-containing protein
MAGELSSMFARASGLLLTEQIVGPAIAKLAWAAQESLPGSSGAGATLIDVEGRATSMASTNSLVEQADRLQYELGEGPCLTAWAGAAPVRIDDASRESRWPAWSKASSRLGLLSCLSVPLLLPEESGTGGAEALGALKVYADRPHAFHEHSEHVLTLLAGPAALMLSNIQAREQAEQLSDSLKAALHSRSVIDMAKGILMERLSVSEREALGVMTARAREEGVLLTQVALGILDPDAEVTSERQ